MKQQKKNNQKSKTSLSELQTIFENDDLSTKEFIESLSEKDHAYLLRKAQSKLRRKYKEKKNTMSLCMMPSTGLTSEPEISYGFDGDSDSQRSLRDSEASRSDPFEDSDDDVLNMALQDVSVSDNEETRYSTEKSIVTKENQNQVRKIDPFNDAGKDIGRAYGYNPRSRAPIAMKEPGKMKSFAEVLVKGLNDMPYDDKVKQKKSDLRKTRLQHRDPEKVKIEKPSEETMMNRIQVQKDHKRELIDLERRRLKEPEPNFINPLNGECSENWRHWFNRRMEQISMWLVEDASSNFQLPPSRECDPPRGIHKAACDWKIFKKTEVEVQWNYDKYGPMIFNDKIAYDGEHLFNPASGRKWENFVEFLESEVKRKYREVFPNAETDVFEQNQGYFWSLLIQQWYDIISVSLFIHF